jgi:hypothetical protein
VGVLGEALDSLAGEVFLELVECLRGCFLAADF